MTPQLVDFNGDGIKDMVMATFEGTAFVVEGSEKGWKPPVHIVDENDTNVRISMYYDTDKNDYASVDRSTDEYESHDNHHMTAVSMVDWDNDGDLDLILGAHEGGLYRCMNIGSKTKPKYAATNELIKVGDKHLALDSLTTPRIVDWDKDGLFDMLLGTVEGEIKWCNNVGKAGEPKFESPQTLLKVTQKLEKQIEFELASITEIAGNPYMEAVDYDNDGDLDLIVGTHTGGQKKGKKLAEEDKQKLAEIEKEMNELNEALMEDLKDVKSAEDYEKLVDEDEELKVKMERIEELYQEKEEISPYFEPPHLIWLFRNKEVDHREKSGEASTESTTTSVEPAAAKDSAKVAGKR